ncbi:MAG: hypothetical protein QM775_10540 [Pirellulales bacterium]
MELVELQQRLRQISAGGNLAWGKVSSGFPELDAVLSEGGFHRGTLVEWLAAEPGAGATQCALKAAVEAMRVERPLVIIDVYGTFHPPGLRDRLEWSRVLLVRCRTQDETAWSVDQALRTSGVGAVLVPFHREDERQMRRWQLAAERGGTLGLVVRHLSRQPEACFSNWRFEVGGIATSEGRRLHIKVLRSRQGGRGTEIEVSLDDHANSLPTSVAFPSLRGVARS